MMRTPRSGIGRNALCLCALVGVCTYWIAHAQQNASTDEARFTGASRSLEAEGWRVSHRWFEAGARTAWHRHPGGQLLFVESGRARVQDRGAAMRELATGETYYTQPNVEHWHGATPDGEFRQVALGRGDADETVWLEKVTDQQYAGR
jgi:quercetin dioxygenase-like cupin family protein